MVILTAAKSKTLANTDFTENVLQWLPIMLHILQVPGSDYP
jgi:hypothetical protein